MPLMQDSGVIILIADIVRPFIGKHKLVRRIVRVVAFLILTVWLYVVHIQIPELVVVPELRHMWVDEAIVLCREMRLTVEVKRVYGRNQDEVLGQSLVPGSREFPNSKILLIVCVGEPVVDPLYGHIYAKMAKATEEEVER